MMPRVNTVASTMFRIVLGIATSLLVLALIFATVTGDAREVGPSRLFDLLRKVSWEPIVVYAVLQWVQAYFRAVRYAVMLRVSGYGRAPRFMPLWLVTMARNMFVDLLPARAGELSYVALLNKTCSVDGSACVSSMGLAVYFDILALVITLGLALAKVPERTVLLGTAIGLGGIVLVSGIILFSVASRVQPWLRRWLDREFSIKAWKHLLSFVQRVFTDVQRVKQQRVLGSVILLSIVIRLAKYLALAVLFLGVAKVSVSDWPRLSLANIVIALIASEATAALPLPSFMSFGTYEMGGLAALSLFGFDPAAAALVMLGTHVVSQAVDYTWGGLSLLGLFVVARPRERKEAVVWEKPSLLQLVMRVALAIFALAGSMLFLAWQWRAFQKLGAIRPPAATGAEQIPTREERARLKTTAKQLKGFVVWSSNRGGNHDIWRMDFPSLRVYSLTHHPHPETYPRISPDGRRIVFARAQLEWVSHRDPRSWDVFVLDMQTGEERCVATNAFYPVWTSDGRILFSRDDRVLTLIHPDTYDSQILLAEGKGTVPQGVTLGNPDYEPDGGRVTVTLRGTLRDVRVYMADGQSFRIGSGRGCQAFWSPDRTFIYYVDHGGRGGNTIYRCNPQGDNPEPWLDLPEPFSHEYFPKLSWDGQWMVLAAAAQGHEHDVADYEVFLWRVGTPETAVIRLTFHTCNDNWPDIFVESAP